MQQNSIDEIRIDSGNGLVLSGSMSLPKPMLIQFYVTIWRHQATMSYLPVASFTNMD